MLIRQDESAPSVAAIIVTYNRIHCLKRCMNSLASQVFKPSCLIVFDNASTDGTKNFFLNELGLAQEGENSAFFSGFYFGIPISYFPSNENKGGSFGFKTALLIAQKTKSDFYWLMDDDVAPEKNCLQNLVHSFSADVAAAYPHRVGEGFREQIAIKQNLTSPFWGLFRPNKKKYFYNGPLENTVSAINFSFEGPLLKREFVEKAGEIDDSFFNQYDDGDYSERMRRFGKILYVGSAIMERQLPAQNGKDNLLRCYYTVRNSILFNKKYTKPNVWKTRALLIQFKWTLSAFLHFNFDKIKIVRTATKDGWNNVSGQKSFS